MATGRQFSAITVAIGLLAVGHALLTWPLGAVLALFGGGAVVAFAAEATVIYVGWLEHHVGPKLLGVPLYVLLGWTGVVYVAFRIGLLLTTGWLAVILAGILATLYDLFTDHVGVESGYWTYIDDLPGPRPRNVPWWNFVGWFVVSSLTAAVAVPLL